MVRFTLMLLVRLLALLCAAGPLLAQQANYDEGKVPEYLLPDPLRFADGAPVRDAAAWQRRRAEILRLFEDQMFGRAPGRPEQLTFAVREEGIALDGAAVRKQVAITCGQGEQRVRLDLLVYLPRRGAGDDTAWPVFLGLNFNGNHAIQADPAIELSRSWMRDRKGSGNEKNKATEAARGTQARRWPVREVIARGAGVATIYYGDIDPDFDDGFENGVHRLFPVRGKEERPGDAWGSIAAWAWGLSRAVDYFETDPRIDAARVIVVGHSRLGKTALWAGAVDPRYAMVVSNDSGCGGAALSRRRFGETVARINRSFPHWFCGNFRTYGDNEDALPFDQHMLIALVAPRPVLVCSAQGDRWADPRGEFLAALHAGPVFRLLGQTALESREMPATGELQKSRVGYFIRAGKHDMTKLDWEAWLAFAAHHGVL